MFLGENLPSWLVLAFGAALAVGNLAALVMPQSKPDPTVDDSGRNDSGRDGSDSDVEGSAGDDDTAQGVERPPLGRSLVMIALGTAASIWAIASLLS